MQRVTPFIVVFCFKLSAFSQSQSKDSLQAKSYNYLYEKIELHENKKSAWPYLNAYLKKAKQNLQWHEIFNGYNYILHESPAGVRLQYADSILYSAEKTDQNDLIGSAYLTKGIVYYNRKDHILALDNFLTANRYISTVNNNYLKYKVKYHIGLIKYYLGFYNEAVSLFSDCLEYFKTEDEVAYIKCLHSLGLSFTRLGKIEESQKVNSTALGECVRLNILEMSPYIKQSQGVNEFYSAHYKTAISTINAALPAIRKDDDFGNEAVGLFYIGKSYWELGDDKRAVTYFQQVDRIFTQKEYIRPDLLENYQLLIAYYKNKKDLKMQLYFINRLLRIDKAMDNTYKYISERLHRQYDTNQLMEAKLEVEKELRKKKAYEMVFIGVIITLLITFFYFIRHHVMTKRRYKKNFETLMSNKSDTESVLPSPPKPTNLDINPEVVEGILRKLEIFEKEKKFLKKEITAQSLADSFNTNYKYFTKVIHFYKQKNFTCYLNDLRIDYIIAQLQSDAKLRMYTYSALADEAGFSTTQHFTTAFLKKAGMSPTFFIDELASMHDRKSHEADDKFES